MKTPERHVSGPALSQKKRGFVPENLEAALAADAPALLAAMPHAIADYHRREACKRKMPVEQWLVTYVMLDMGIKKYT